MAKHWFTLDPSNYFMRQSRRGGRREILFTLAAMGFLHYTIFSPIRQSYKTRGVQLPWQRTTINGEAWTL